MALLVLPLFASQVFAISITYKNLDTLQVPFGKISKNTDDRALLGFKIYGVTSTKYLEYVNLKSFIQKAYSVEHLKLYMETNDTVGLQVPGDQLLQYKDIRNRRFDSNDTMPFTSLHRLLNQDPDSTLFYVAIDAFTDTVGAHPDLYDGQCLEVIVLPGKMRLSPLDTNADTIYNRRYSSNPLDDTTGFCPDDPQNHGYPGCRYRLCFDTRGPQFTLHFCVGDSTCPDNQTIAQGDTVQICATDINEPVVGCIHVFGRVLTDWDHEVSSAEMFLQDSIVLCRDICGEEGKQRCECPACDDTFHVKFVIPDFANGVNGVPPNRLPYSGDMRGIDADTGQWFVCAWAKDSAGNIDTICIGHDDLLPWKIDTRKPNIDSVSFFLWWDKNHDGKVALGDTVAVFGWASSNVWVPQLEVDSMIADMSHFGQGRVWLNDVDNNNKVFRAYVCLDVPVLGLDTTDCVLNSIKVWAWDNACNYDTARKGICNPVDLEKPGIDQVVYKYYLDYDTSHSCIGIGDTVEITAITAGSDIESVTVDMKDAGIDSLIRTALPLPYKSIDTYDTIWTVTKPPIDDGKDKDNTVPPLNDAVYTVRVTACDDAGNCSTLVSNVLNRTLDTRRPRPIGYFCQDTVPCALHAVTLAHGVIQLYWKKTCQEKDAWYFYVYDSTESSGGKWDSIGATYENETGNPNYNFWTSEPLPAGYYHFKVQTEDSCDNLGPFSCEVAAFADSTPPKACLVFPDSGGIYGAPFTVKARTEDRDIFGASLWYRLRADLNDPPTGPIGPWTPCLSFPSMYRPDSGLVFLDTVACIHDYVGMVELMPLSCDVYGNCQDTIRGYQDACIDDSLQNLRPGHFLFDWDTTRACALLVSVNDTISPQTSCGFNVRSDTMNQVVISVDGAKPTDLFTIDVFALVDNNPDHRIDYRNHVTMPCTIMVSVDNWDFGTQNLYVHITAEANGKECVPCPMIIDLCVPWQTTPCITIVRPLEWTRIACSKTDKTCDSIWAEITPGCPESLVTQVKFFYSKSTPGPPWNLIEEVVEPDTVWVLGHPKLYWRTCWNNLGLVQDGDTVYFMAEGFNQYHISSGPSKMVKVYMDCKAPTVKLRIEDVITTCQGIPKVSGEVTLKALVVDTLVDITDVVFWYKLHSDPDLPAYWDTLSQSERGGWWESDNELEPWSENIWMGGFDTEDLLNNTWYDIRVSVKDQAGNMWQDYDEDGMFDDSTFLDAVAAGAGITVFVDNEAPQPAITMVADTAAKIYNVNPSTLLGGSGETYVKAGDDINAQISVLPSEDTCEVMKVEWFLCMPVDDFFVTAPKPSPAQGGKTIPHVEHQGDNCENPIELTLPRDLAFDDTNHTCGRFNDYDKTCLKKLDESEDIIYKLNVTMNVILNIQWWTSKAKESGLALFSECPGHHDGGPALSGSNNDDHECIEHEDGHKSHHWHHLSHDPIRLEPGTYYLMLDTPKDCIGEKQASPGAGEIGQAPAPEADYFELQITGEATGCKFVGLSNDPYHFPVNFNPVKDGLIPAYELEDHFWQGQLQAVLYDSLGNSKTDNVDLYILDVTASQAVIVDPLNDSYVSGDVLLQSRSLNDYEICKVCYEYKPEGDSVWYPVNFGYPNACVTQEGNGPQGAAQRVGGWQQRDFSLTWHTLNSIPDGAYYLRAVATDCSNNVDTLPPTIKVTVSNGTPTVTMIDPGTCPRTCPDDTVDTLGYVSGTVSLYATATSTIPVDHVVFMYKDIFEDQDGGPDDWQTIGTDYFPTDGKYSVEWSTPSDGRYHLKAIAYTSSGKSGESEWIVISVDNSGPFTEIISIMGNQHPDGMDITKGAVIPIQVVAIDSTSSDGWTRCYNSGLTKISVCIAMCDSNYNPKDTTEITKCFEVDSVYDGIHTVEWNTSGLEYAGCKGCYYIYVKAYDCLGNVTVSDSVKVYVSDITAPVTTIGGFDGDSIYAYSSEPVQTLLFEYADSGTTNWIPIGWSSYVGQYCDYLYKTSWKPASLKDGHYQIRVISHDTCSNQNDSLAPVAYFTVGGGTITPYNPGVLGALSFMKNWCVGGMHGLVHETCSHGTPVVIARYGSSYTYECVEMQANLNYPHDYDGSFFAHDIEYGGPAKFFSSVTVKTGDLQMTGEPAYVTYLAQGTFDVVQVKRDYGTHGTYQDSCVQITIPAGAVGSTFVYDRYIWVSPTIMPWVPLTQPDLNPIGDNDGYATYVAFTDCYYCCGWWSSHYGGKQDDILKSPGGGNDCCFNPGQTHYAKIKMCYDTLVTTDKEHLAVMWWDCESGEFKSDNIYYPPGVEGFNTTNHTVEFATSCLSGPFAVVQLLERPCDGSIVVNMRAEDITPYVVRNDTGYTNTTPTFTSFINDRVQGTKAIDQSSIQFKVDLFNPGELIRIYTGMPSSLCSKWMTGFGSFNGSGYDAVPGIFKAGWNDPTYYNYYDWGTNCQGCDDYYCQPKYPLAAGDHMATVSAQNYNIQTCTDTVHFKVDATPPNVVFEDRCLNRNPEFLVTIIDRESGVNKDSVWIYTSYGPYDLSPDQLAPMWINDSTIDVKLPVNISSSTDLVVYVYEGTKNGNLDPDLEHGPVDMVGNKATSFWHRYRVDVTAPTIALMKPSYRFHRPVLFNLYDDDAGCGIDSIYVAQCTGLTGPCAFAPAESVVYDPQAKILSYNPPQAGTWIQVIAKDLAKNTKVLDSVYCVEDYDPPMVKFVPSYYNGTTLCKDDPTIKFVVTDGVAGVNWNTVNVDIDACGQLITYPFTEVINHRGIGPNDTVTLTPPIKNCSDGAAVNVYVYSDSRYGKGPADNGDTYLKNVAKWTYYADASGPTITLKTPSDSLFNRPLLFEIKDTKSGLADISVFQDSVAASIIAPYAHNLGWYALSPSAGQHKINIIATDSCGNSTNYFIFTRDDLNPPVVTFLPGFVNCVDPTISATILDPSPDPSGVDWSKVKVDLYYSNYLQEAVPYTLSAQTLTVTGDGDLLQLSDGVSLTMVVYSAKSYGTNYTKGPVDLAGNYQTSAYYYSKSYVADCLGPTITWRSGADSCSRPLLFTITDNRSGVDDMTISITEDGETVTTWSYDVQTDTLKYTPSAGKHKVEIKAYDKVGNPNHNSFVFWSKDDCTPPVVSFVPSFVSCKTPTVNVVVTDAGTGVDWSKLKVDLYYSSLLLQTFEPSGPNAWTREDSIITVVGNGAQLNLSDGSDLYAVVYSEKSSATSYTKGPVDLAGNWTDTKWITKDYKADCYGPSITWRGTNYCDDSLKFEITDAKSTLAGVYVFEDSAPKPLIRRDEHNPIYWYYYPSGNRRHHVDIRAVDMVDNPTVYSFDVTGDCKPPVVTFTPSWINCTNPTVTFQITDDVTGVDWNKVNVDLYYSSTRIQTFTPLEITHDLNGFVTVPGDGAWLGLIDNAALNVVVYSQKNYGTSYTRGPVDLAGNYQTSSDYYLKAYYADCVGPTITWSSGADSCADLLRFEIKDARSGMASIAITEDGEPVTTGFYYNDTTQILSYSRAGRHNVKIKATDNVGNKTIFEFWRKGDCTPPTVAFGGGYLSCANPTVSIQVTDDASGVDWSTLHVDLYTSAYRLQTFNPEDLVGRRTGNVITVTADGDLFNLSDGSLLQVAVYSYKTSGTGYIKGPTDSAGNWTQTQWIQKEYYVDCIAPIISWINSSDPCERPVKLQITDNKSGVDGVKAYQDGIELKGNAFYYDTTSSLWYLTPTAGMHNIDVVATDVVGNQNTKSFKVKDDCQGPAVSFATGFVSKNPTIQFTVSDPSGVDWNTVNARIYGCGKECIYPAPELKKHVTEGGVVTLDDCILDCNDGSVVDVYVYSGTNWYGMGPADLFGNYLPMYVRFSYVVDASAPSIVWTNSSDPCNRPVKLQITDSKSGVDEVKAYQDGVALSGEAFVYDAASGLWYLYPSSAGKHTIVVVATDVVGNKNTISFEVKDDCLPPGVEFVKGYVTKNPTVKFVVRDDKVDGVDWKTVNVDLYQRDNPYKQCTFTAADIANFGMKHGDTVVVSCTMDLTDKQSLVAYVYSEKTASTSYGKGPADLLGNFMPKWQECIYPVDAKGPVLKILTPTYATPIRVQVQDTASGVNPTSFEIRENGIELSYNYDASTNVLTFTPTAGTRTTVTITVADNLGNLGSLSYRNWDEDAVGPVLDTNLVKQTLMAPPIKIKFTDDKSGVNWDSLTFKVDGHVVPHESLTIERAQGLIEYTPEPGRKQIVISVKDNAGNMSGVWPFWSEAGELYFTGKGGTYNYPNPFDPREKMTCIVLGLSKSVLATIKIYDFAGEYVRTLGPPDQVIKPNQELCWDGKTDDGTEVANGTYLCYIKARDLDASKTVTAVIKITVLKKDK